MEKKLCSKIISDFDFELVYFKNFSWHSIDTLSFNVKKLFKSFSDRLFIIVFGIDFKCKRAGDKNSKLLSKINNSSTIPAKYFS